MATQDAATVALVGCVVFFTLAFGLRSVVQYRRTGATGFVGVKGRPGSADWWGGGLFAAAMVGAFVAPVLQLVGAVEGYDIPFPRMAQIVGCLLYAVGVAGTLWAQFAMGDSWRIGVDSSARTALVAGGPFRWVRNPIYTAMSIATIGLVLLVPNVVALMTLAVLAVALQIQVRLVEEPYLTKAHGEVYRRYAASAGRFLPRIGRMEEVR